MIHQRLDFTPLKGYRSFRRGQPILPDLSPWPAEADNEENSSRFNGVELLVYVDFISRVTSHEHSPLDTANGCRQERFCYEREKNSHPVCDCGDFVPFFRAGRSPSPRRDRHRIPGLRPPLSASALLPSLLLSSLLSVPLRSLCGSAAGLCQPAAGVHAACPLLSAPPVRPSTSSANDTADSASALSAVRASAYAAICAADLQPTTGAAVCAATDADLQPTTCAAIRAATDLLSAARRGGKGDSATADADIATPIHNTGQSSANDSSGRN
jgi:hypothetical protein